MNGDCDKCKYRRGWKGESTIHNILYKLTKYINIKWGQIDIVAEVNKKWYSFEIKNQEKFMAPPFDGHGLPPHQVNFRLKLSEYLGITPIFIVVDDPTEIIYYQSIEKLERNCNRFDSKTGDRVIYPLTDFKILDKENILEFASIFGEPIHTINGNTTGFDFTNNSTATKHEDYEEYKKTFSL